MKFKQKDMIERPRIIDVVRKPRKCSVCGERVVDIIYGTGDMTEIELTFGRPLSRLGQTCEHDDSRCSIGCFLAYRQEGIVGGDSIPRRPPIWKCSCGCKRFRKVNPDGTDAPVKVKMLKNMRKRSAKVINWEAVQERKSEGDIGSLFASRDLSTLVEMTIW